MLWLERWSTPEALAGAKRSEVITAWGRLGYPRRALRLHESAGVISQKFDNKVPESIADLRSLPGVGEYTAAAIAAFAFDQSTLVLDINIRRLFSRVIDGVEYPTTVPSQLERRFRSELIPYDGAKWAAATMELGALVCTSRNPKCDLCPLMNQCEWRKAGYPKSTLVRKVQSWVGTDRQCRGTIVQALRENKSQTQFQLNRIWHDNSQLEMALKTLIADGLIENHMNSYRLPR